MSNAHYIIFENVVPALGAVLAIFMAASPTRTVWRTRRRKDIGEFNPLPTVVLVGNLCSWNMYAALSRDPYLTVAASVGLMVAVFNTLVLFGQAKQRIRDRLLTPLMVYLTVVLSLVAVTSLGSLPHSSLELMWGTAGNVGSILYYLSPMATVMKVFRQQDSSSIHIANSVTSVVNCALWISYFVTQGKGKAGQVIIPTFTYYAGASLNIACLWLCWRFPRRKWLQEAADGEPTAAAAPAASGASFAATDIGGGSAFAQPSGAVEARTPRALEVEGSAYSAPVPSSALRSRSLVQAVSAYLPGSPTGLDRLPSGAFWLHVGDGSQPAGHASTGGEGSEDGERMPATPPTTPLVRTAHGLSGI